MEPMGKQWNPANRWFVTVHEVVYFGPTTKIFLSSIAAAAACPLIRAVDPRRPAPHSGHRVAPRLDNRLSPSSLRSMKLVLSDC